MEDEILTKTDASEFCGWCFEMDADVLEHASSHTFWHEDCFAIAKLFFDDLAPKQAKDPRNR